MRYWNIERKMIPNETKNDTNMIQYDAKQSMEQWVWVSMTTGIII